MYYLRMHLKTKRQKDRLCFLSKKINLTDYGNHSRSNHNKEKTDFLFRLYFNTIVGLTC